MVAHDKSRSLSRLLLSLILPLIPQPIIQPLFNLCSFALARMREQPRVQLVTLVCNVPRVVPDTVQDAELRMSAVSVDVW